MCIPKIKRLRGNVKKIRMMALKILTSVTSYHPNCKQHFIMSTKDSKQERLNHLVKSYRKDFDNVWNKYTALCKRTSTKIKQYLEDASLYKEANLSISSIQAKIQKAMNNIIKSNEGLRKEYDDARAAKRQKKEQENADSRNLQCEKCNGKKIISINSKACDNNHVILPWGETIEGYCPQIPAVTMAGGDGASFDLCVDCGYIVGFDRDAVKAALDELADMSGYDDE